MITFHMLLTPDNLILDKARTYKLADGGIFPSPPDTIKVVRDWGDISVFFVADKIHRHGRHVQVEGELEEIDKWLMSVPGEIIIGVGPPICQSFMICDYRKGGVLAGLSLSYVNRQKLLDQIDD